MSGKRGSLGGLTVGTASADTVTLSSAQTITGAKTFTKKTKFNSDVSTTGFFIGDGSLLTNIPGTGGTSYLHYPVAQGPQTLQAVIVNGASTFNSAVTLNAGAPLTVNGATNFNSSVTFNQATSPPHCLAPPVNPNDLCNKAYVDSQAPLTSFQLFCNYSQTFPSPGLPLKLLSSSEVYSPTTVPFATTNNNTTLLASFFNSKTTLNIPNTIPPGNWTLNVYANVLSIEDQGSLGLSYTLCGITSGGAESVLYTSSSSTLISVVSPSKANYAMTITLPSTDISSYTSIGVRLYVTSNVNANRSGNIFFQDVSSYTNLLTSFAVTSPNDILQANNTWSGVNTFEQPVTFNSPNITINGTNNFNVGTGSGSLSNTVIGFNTPKTIVFTTGNNTFIGSQAGQNVTTASESNTFVGCLAGTGITTGKQNTFLGAEAGNPSTGTGWRNTAVGFQSLKLMSGSAENNVAIGAEACNQLTGGYNNTCIGWGAGGNITTGANNICIGRLSGPTSGTADSQIIIGSSSETMFIKGGLNFLVGETITSSTNGDISAGPIATYYNVQMTLSGQTITLPDPSNANYKGTRIIFKRINTTPYTLTSPGTNPFLSTTSVTYSASPTPVGSAVYQLEIMCDGQKWCFLSLG